jgi:hypothetical protein
MMLDRDIGSSWWELPTVTLIDRTLDEQKAVLNTLAEMFAEK